MHTRPHADILRSRAFAMEALRSERARVAVTIAALLIVLAFVVIRNLVVLAPGERSAMLPAVVLGVIAIGYESLLLVLVVHQLRRDQPMPELAWWLNVAVESLFPALVITVLAEIQFVDPYHALTAPAVALFFMVIVLATLRLRPAMCLLSGTLAGAGYGGAVAYVFAISPASEAPAAQHPAVYLTWVVTLLVTGLVAAAVAGQIRNHVASALREAQERQRDMLRARNTLIFGLAKLAEYRDTDTGAHLERIAAYARLLARALRDRFDEIDDDWIETIAVASSMHDIGKVGIPDGVLQKPGRLDEEERRVIERHPALGSEALRAIRERHGDDPLLVMSDEIAIGHHERWDGAGYPGRVPGPEIALPARIISVADVYDALTSARVYKPAMSHDEATRIIREGRGSQFDPVVVDAFVGIGAEFDEVRRRYAEAEGRGADAS